MTKAEDLARKAEQSTGTAHHVDQLIAHLIDPTGWELIEMVDAGEGAAKSLNPPRCACGHPIRFIFIVEATRDLPPSEAWPSGRPKGDRAHVGSVCIQQIAHLAPELAERILAGAKDLERRAAEAQRQAELARKQAEVEALERQFRALHNQLISEFRRYRATGDYAPYELWEAVCHRKHCVPQAPPQYSSPALYIRWYRKHIEQIQRVLGARSQ
jgi:hypothetical protein